MSDPLLPPDSKPFGEWLQATVRQFVKALGEFLHPKPGPNFRPPAPVQPLPTSADSNQTAPPFKFAPPTPPRAVTDSMSTFWILFLIFGGGIAVLGVVGSMAEAGHYRLEKTVFDATNDQLVALRGTVFFGCCGLAVVGFLLVELLRSAVAIERRLAESHLHSYEFYRRMLEIEQARDAKAAESVVPRKSLPPINSPRSPGTG